MCDDFFDDFDGDYDEGPEDNGDDGFCDDCFEDTEPDGDTAPDTEDGSWDGLQWQDWMLIGPLSEDIVREKREKERIRRENEEDQGDYWSNINEL